MPSTSLCFALIGNALLPRYLLESGAWSEEIELMKTAFEVCKDKNGLDYAHLCNTHACVQVERGKAYEAISLIDKAIAIRTKILGPTHVETAHSYNNYANSAYLMWS